MAAIGFTNIRRSREAFRCRFMGLARTCKGAGTGYSEASGAAMTLKYPVAMEQAEDGSWSAYTLSPTVMTGLGDSKEAALADLDAAAKFWVSHVKETGQTIPVAGVEVTSIEVAA
jgi:predicted RNase H-like HicB family nuclease